MAGHSPASQARTASSPRKARGPSSSRSTAGGSRRRTPGTSASGSVSRDDYVVTAEELKRFSRPFNPAVLRRAKAVARRYQLVIAPEPGLGYMGRTVEMPLVMSDGKTIPACASAVLDATTIAIATLLERGEKPPAPAREGKRDQQVNLRLTAEEKMRLEEASRRDGFRSLSDFLRAAGMQRAG